MSGSIEITETQNLWVSRLMILRAKRKELEAKETEVVKQIRMFMRDADVATIGGEAVLLNKKVVSMRLDVKRIREEYPNIAEMCSIVSASQRLEFPS